MSEAKAIAPNGAVPGIYAALVRAQKAAQAVAKDSKNSFHGYKYASAEAIIEEARGALSAAGLAVFALGWTVKPPNGTGFSAMVVHYRMAHESGEILDFQSTETAVIPEKGRPEDKAEATALTYNLGYFLRGLLLLPREEPDANPDKRDDRSYEPKPALAAEDQTRIQATNFEAFKKRLLDAGKNEPERTKVYPEIKDAHEKGLLTEAQRKLLLAVANAAASGVTA